MKNYPSWGGPYNPECRHEGDWERHHQAVLEIITAGRDSGTTRHYSREWQERVCKNCGFTERSEMNIR